MDDKTVRSIPLPTSVLYVYHSQVLQINQFIDTTVWSIPHPTSVLYVYHSQVLQINQFINYIRAKNTCCKHFIYIQLFFKIKTFLKGTLEKKSHRKKKWIKTGANDRGYFFSNHSVVNEAKWIKKLIWLGKLSWCKLFTSKVRRKSGVRGTWLLLSYTIHTRFGETVSRFVCQNTIQIDLIYKKNFYKKHARARARSHARMHARTHARTHAHTHRDT